MKVLGLDPSLTNFGWCYYDSDQNQVLEKGLFKTKPTLSFIERNIFLRQSVLELGTRLGVDKVGIEHPVFHDLYSEGMYGLFLFTCEALLNLKLDTVFFAPLQVKAHARDFLGYEKKWKMQKADMVNATKKKIPDVKKWNHNEADAFWIAYAASRFWDFQAGSIKVLTETEDSQFAKTHTFSRGKKAGQTENSGIIHKLNDRYFLWSTPSCV